MVTKVTLALIGDIHYPEYESATCADAKDKGIGGQLLSKIAPNKLKKVSDEISRRLKNTESIKAVLLCGDLTTKGNLIGYKNCVNYLKSVLDLENTSFWQDKHLHVVPGNHDIDRKAKHESSDIYAKFNQIREAWLEIKRDEMQPATVRQSDIKYSNFQATIFSVNSCVGCGEVRKITNNVSIDINDIIKKSDENYSNEDIDTITEQLDTPAIDENHLDQITISIRNLKKFSDIPVLLAHHGLLPQATTRIQVYSELINSGNVRFALSNLEKPIIYCHGHIHQESIEVITSPHSKTGKVITISAPLFSDGFNLINIIFNNDGLPMGCEIIPIRLANAVMVEAASVRIPLQESSNIYPLSEILKKSLEATRHTPLRSREIMEKLTLSEADAMDAFIELEWLGLVEIINREEDYRHWQIKRNAP